MTSDCRRLTRDLVELSGPDTLTLLQGLLTTDVHQIEPGAIGHTALLSPQGKILETLFLHRTGEATVIAEVFAGRGAGFMKKMMLYRLRAKVEITDRTAELTGGIGPAPEAAIIAGGDPRHAGLPPKWLAPTPDVPGGDDLLIDTEIALGIPAFGTAYHDGDAFPLGVNLDRLGGIDHHKGCFVGQEVASRMYRKGSIRKRTWQLSGDGAAPCDDLTVDGRVVAMVSAVSGGAGLALMRLDRIGEVTELDAETPSGTTVRLTRPDYLS